MRVFITGATGFIGQALMSGLQVAGHQITALVRDPDSPAAARYHNRRVTLVKGDILDRASLRAGMAGAEVVIHAAGCYEFGPGPGGRAKMTAINVEGTANTLGIARELGVQRIIYVSTAFAYGETDGQPRDESWVRRSPPRSHYEATKTTAHELALTMQREGAPIIIACPVAVIGRGDHANLGMLARLYVRRWLPPVMFGDGVLSFAHVEDVAAALTRCVDRGRIGETYLLTGGVLSLREMFALWHTMPGGMQFVLFWMPRRLAIIWCALMQPLQWLLRLPRLFSIELARSAYMDLQFVSDKATRDLGIDFRSPRQAWRDTLKSEHYRAKGY